MIKISGFLDEVNLSPEAQIAMLKELGECYMCPRKLGKKNIADYSIEEFKSKVFPLLNENGIKFSSIGSPIGKICLYDDKAFDIQLKQLENLVEIAKLMQCKYIRIFSFHVDKNGNYDSYFPLVIDKLRKLLRTVEGTDIILLHENEKHIFGDIPSRCLAIIREIQHPNFKLVFDSSNFIQCGSNPLEAYELLKEYVVYYHIKDCSSEKVEVPLGLGVGCYREILSDLINNRNYEGFLTLEPHTLKYALLRKAVYVFYPIVRMLKTIKALPEVYRRIDKAYGKKALESVSLKEVYKWQYDSLKNILADVSHKKA